MSIVQQLVSHMNGTIDIKSELGCGIRVEILYPSRHIRFDGYFDLKGVLMGILIREENGDSAYKVSSLKLSHNILI